MTGDGMLFTYDNNGKLKSKYIGQIIDGVPQGSGTLILYDSDGKMISKFIGHFKDGSMHGEGSMFLISLLLMTVWMCSSWHLTLLLDRTAFGKARTDIVHEDLQAHEVAAIYLFLVAAGLWGIFT